MKENKTKMKDVMTPIPVYQMASRIQELIDKRYKMNRAESELQQTLSQREKEFYTNMKKTKDEIILQGKELIVKRDKLEMAEYEFEQIRSQIGQSYINLQPLENICHICMMLLSLI